MSKAEKKYQNWLTESEHELNVLSRAIARKEKDFELEKKARTIDMLRGQAERAREARLIKIQLDDSFDDTIEPDEGDESEGASTDGRD